MEAIGRRGTAEVFSDMARQSKRMHMRGERSFTACCPAHDDGEPSLSVTLQDNGNITLKCHAGCTAESVAQGYGLGMRDLFADAGRRPEAPGLRWKSWEWTTPDGRKRRQFRIDDGGKRWKKPEPDGSSPRPAELLYWPGGIPESGLLVFAEGASSADALHEKGLAAAASFRGVVSAEWLERIPTDVEIAVWPDKDSAGRDEASRLVHSLRSAGRRAGVVDPSRIDADAPPKFDPRDWKFDGSPDEACRIVESAVQESRTAPPPQLIEDDGRRKAEICGITEHGLEQAFKAVGLECRYNLRKEKPQVRAGGGEWRDAPKRRQQSIQELIARRCVVGSQEPGEDPKRAMFGSETWSRCFGAMLAAREVDPFIEWLEGLPEWDGIERLDSIIEDVWSDTGETPSQVRRWASRYPFLAVVQRTFEPGCRLREIPIYIGPEDCGKSAILLHVLPEEHREEFVEGLDLAGDDKKLTEAVRGSTLVEAAEMAGLNKADIASIKAFIARTNDGHVRMAYEASRESAPRRCAIVGTANPTAGGFLPGEGKNTRFVPVEIEDEQAECGPVEPWMDARREQMFAEAVHRYRNGERANLPRELQKDVAPAREKFRKRNLEFEDAAADLDPRDPRLGGVDTNRGTAYKFSDIAEHVGAGKNAIALARALQNAGWKSQQARPTGLSGRGTRRMFWFPPEPEAVEEGCE